MPVTRMSQRQYLIGRPTATVDGWVDVTAMGLVGANDKVIAVVFCRSYSRLSPYIVYSHCM